VCGTPPRRNPSSNGRRQPRVFSDELRRSNRESPCLERSRIDRVRLAGVEKALGRTSLSGRAAAVPKSKTRRGRTWSQRRCLSGHSAPRRARGSPLPPKWCIRQSCRCYWFRRFARGQLGRRAEHRTRSQAGKNQPYAHNWCPDLQSLLFSRALIHSSIRIGGTNRSPSAQSFFIFFWFPKSSSPFRSLPLQHDNGCNSSLE
jgi:hypothetical protein